MPFRPPIHQPVRADRPGKTVRPSQAGSFYRSAEWTALREAVLIRDGYRCQLRYDGCYQRAVTAHHIIARKDGGADALFNLHAVCGRCHARAHPEKGGSHV